MQNRFRPLSALRETAPVLAVVLAVLTVIGVSGPAAGQSFPFAIPFFDGFQQPQPQPQPQPQRPRPSPSGSGLFGGGSDAPYFAPFQNQRRPVVREDYSRAPAPEKRAENAAQPERSIVVLGDAMADWLGYGLEDAYAEQTDVGILRRIKTYSGLIRYQPKGDPADWPAAAKGILASENPAAIVIMLGLTDRMALRETNRTDKKPADALKPGAKPTDKPDADLADDADIADPAPIVAPEKGSRSASGTYEFREDRWVELYTKKIEEMIAVAKTKGVPVVWVGLPAVRGVKATADMLFLNGLYRDVAQKAGITFVDVWDGFVDEAGRFMQQGPDFEGQTRRLRSYDGVYFTKAGARKLAHYAEREINRLLASRSAPVEMPIEPEKPEIDIKPGSPSTRPLAGPIVPLVATQVATDQLMGGPVTRPTAVNPMVAKTLVKGEALAPPPGRADDGVWPRRDVGREAAPIGGGMPEMASTATGVTSVMAAPAPMAPEAARRKIRPSQQAQIPGQPVQQQAQPAPVASNGFDFFGLGSFASQPVQRVQQQAQPAYPQQQRQREPPPRPTGPFGFNLPSQGGSWFSR